VRGDQLLICFYAGGLLDLANHLFNWAGDLWSGAKAGLRAFAAKAL
jgi:hypothetical protein